MPSTTLSAAERSFMNDPKAFRDRMIARAATLWNDGYGVRIGEEPCTFNVHTPKGELYTVAPLDELCMCSYQTKREVPQVPCKHLLGLEMLIERQCTDYLRFARQSKRDDADRASYWKQQHDALKEQWRETLERAAMQNEAARIAEEDEDGQAFMQNLLIERGLLR